MYLSRNVFSSLIYSHCYVCCKLPIFPYTFMIWPAHQINFSIRCMPGIPVLFCLQDPVVSACNCLSYSAQVSLRTRDICPWRIIMVLKWQHLKLKSPFCNWMLIFHAFHKLRYVKYPTLMFLELYRIWLPQATVSRLIPVVLANFSQHCLHKAYWRTLWPQRGMLYVDFNAKISFWLMF